MTEGFDFAAVYPVLPELILVVGAMALLMIGAWRGDRVTAGLSGLAVMLLVVAGVLIATMGGDKTVAFGGSFVVDRFAKFLKLLVLVGSIGTILLSVEFRRDVDRRKFEYPILILLASAGLFIWNLARFHRAPHAAPAPVPPQRYALAVVPPLHVPSVLNGFALWNVVVLVLMLTAYGYPIAQSFILAPPQANVHRVSGRG